MRRRDFLGALAGLGVAGSAGAWIMPRVLGRGTDGIPERWGVQLYTVRGAMADDVRGTLEAVAEMGYGEVEFAGLFGLSAREMRGLLGSVGLRAASSHVGMEVIRGDWDATLDAAAALGQDLIVLPSLPSDVRTADSLRALAGELSRAGEAATARGLHLGFHNHDFEVTPLGPEAGGDGTWASRPLDILLANSDPEHLSFQLDLFWTVQGAADPEAYFADYPGRFLSVHVKDRTEDGQMVDVGAGVMDFRRLLAAGEAAGVRHAFVEHDRPAQPLESIRASIRHLQTFRG